MTVKGRTITCGTSYFVSIELAIGYYRLANGDDPDAAISAVARKLKDGEIHIGEPPLLFYGQRIVLVDDGRRYAIEVDA
jgi:hypothetical protein